MNNQVETTYNNVSAMFNANLVGLSRYHYYTYMRNNTSPRYQIVAQPAAVIAPRVVAVNNRQITIQNTRTNQIHVFATKRLMFAANLPNLTSYKFYRYIRNGTSPDYTLNIVEPEPILEEFEETIIKVFIYVVNSFNQTIEIQESTTNEILVANFGDYKDLNVCELRDEETYNGELADLIVEGFRDNTFRNLAGTEGLGVLDRYISDVGYSNNISFLILVNDAVDFNNDQIRDFDAIAHRDIFHDVDFDLEADNLMNGNSMEILKIPYKYFGEGHADDCVYKTLTKRYSNIKRNPIAEKKVRKYIPKQENGNSLNHINAFCEKFKITYKCYDIFGGVLKQKKFDSKSSNRKRLYFIMFNNHMYPCSDYRKKNMLELKSNRITEDNYVIPDNEISLKVNDKTYTASGIYNEINMTMEEIETAFFKTTVNFSFKSELKLKMRALNVNTGSIIQPNGQLTHEYIKTSPFLGSETILHSYDMVKAYYTSMELNKDKTFPIFTIFDVFEPVKITSINMIHNLGYYGIRKEAVHNHAFLQQNFTHGFYLKELIKMDMLKFTDIEHCKIPSYTNKIKQYYDVIETLEKDKKKKAFVLYNGILGKNSNYTKYSKSVNKICYDDINTMEHTYKECDNYDFRYTATQKKDSFEWDDFEYKASLVFDNGKRKFYHLNTVSFYNFIVEYTNLLVLRKSNDVGICKIRGIKTDAVIVETRNDSDYSDNLFIYEKEIKFSGNGTQTVNLKTILNFDKIKNLSIKEIETAFKSCKSITGAPGTGKSYQVRNNLKFHFGATISNICVRNMKNGIEDTQNKNAKHGIKTLYSTFALYNPDQNRKVMKNFRNKTLWVDETAYIQKYYFNYLFLLANNYNTKMIFTFDIEQLKPVKEFNAYSLSDDEIFAKIINKKQLITLKKNYRCSEDLLKFASNYRVSEDVKTPSGYELSEHMRINYRDYNLYNGLKGYLRNINVHLCHTHIHRKLINKMIMLSRRLTYEYKLVKLGTNINSKDSKFDINKSAKENNYIESKYSFKISKGVRLMVRQNFNTEDLQKSDLYEVVKNVEHTDKLVELKQIYTDRVIKIKTSLLNYFQIGFAFTIHSLQGITINEKFVIYEALAFLKHGDDGKRLMYVALTRAKKKNQIKIHYIVKNYITVLKNKFPPIEYPKINEPKLEILDLKTINKNKPNNRN